MVETLVRLAPRILLWIVMLTIAWLPVSLQTLSLSSLTLAAVLTPSHLLCMRTALSGTAFEGMSTDVHKLFPPNRALGTALLIHLVLLVHLDHLVHLAETSLAVAAPVMQTSE